MKLHLGCHRDIRPGWVNIDVLDIDHSDYIKWNLLDGLPPQVQEISKAYSSHTLEHFKHQDCVKLLKEIHFRMVPGGVVRSGIPDFHRLIKAYMDNNWNFFNHCLEMAPNRQMLEIINASIYQYDDEEVNTHKCMYDVEYAIFTHKLAGFSECVEVPFDPAYGDHMRAPYTFYVLATK